MDRERHRQIEKLADGVRRSGSLPAELDAVLAAGIEATRPEPSHYSPARTARR